MSQQFANALLMVRPASFGFNEQTALDNYYQRRRDDLSPAQTNRLAQAEFDQLVAALREQDIEVVSVDDQPQPRTTDAVFPNNWVSMHADGRVVLYPMCAPIRRLERRTDVLELLQEQYGFAVAEVLDWSGHETDQRFLEGTGAIIFDHLERVAYLARSPRAEQRLFERLCAQLGYRPISFAALQTVANQRRPIYHTNVMMSIADRFAVVCADSIDDQRERELVLASLRGSGRDVIEISEAQTAQFAGNVLQVGSRRGEPYLVMSSSAFDAFTDAQQTRFTCPVIHCPIPTIETLGGGSARCMLAEIFLPRG